MPSEHSTNSIPTVLTADGERADAWLMNEPSRWTTIEDARQEIEDLMGDQATREIATAVTERLRRNGVITHDGKALVADLEPVDLWSEAEAEGL